MIYEKSCGAVIYTLENGNVHYLVEEMLQGHFALCKGHVEAGETEVETARREILEETGLQVSIDTEFRHEITYSPFFGCQKTVVYFAALALNTETTPQPEEVRTIRWLPYEQARKILTYENDKLLLDKFSKYIQLHS